MKKNALLVLALFGFLFLSCKQEMIPESGFNAASASSFSDATQNVVAPVFVNDDGEKLGASNGSYRNILLSWRPSPSLNVVQYRIFAADDPYTTPEVVAHTDGKSNSISLPLNSGITQYYFVQTVCRLNGKLYYSPLSAREVGSTMCTPVVTSVKADGSGKNYTVKWWMSNCTTETYLEKVVFKVYCLQAGQSVTDKNILSKELTYADIGDNFETTFSGLEDSVDYYFQVMAYVEGDGSSAHETSFAKNIKTAANYNPRAVSDLIASQGTSEFGISVSFVLPKAVQFYTGELLDSFHPVYVNVARKVVGEPDTKYKTLVKKLGCQLNSEESSASEKRLIYNNSGFVGTQASAFENLEFTYALPENPEPLSSYPNYVPGAKVTILDKDAEKGKQYVYRVVSYVDDTTSELSSDDSVVTSEGWLINKPTFFAQEEYRDDAVYDESGNIVTPATKFVSVDVNFTVGFDNIGNVPYKYVIQEGYNKDDGDADPTSYKHICFGSISDLNSYKRTFSELSTPEIKGYYTYKMFIAALDEGETPETVSSRVNEGEFTGTKYFTQPYEGNIYVTDNISAKPVLERFEVKDAYTDFFILTWDYHAGQTYSISWIDGNGDINKKALTKDTDYTVSGDVATYNHPVTPYVDPADAAMIDDPDELAKTDDRYINRMNARSYTLWCASSEVKISKVLPDVYYSLYKPRPQVTAYAYDKINLSWPKVQGAKEYIVTAKYTDPAADIVSNIVIPASENPEWSLDFKDDGGVLYDNLTRGGDNVAVSVTAVSENAETTPAANEKSEAVINTYTMGPSQISAETFDCDSEDINLRWKKIEGAAGYLIYRNMYKIPTDYTADFTESDSVVSLYYNALENKVYADGDNSSCGGRTSVRSVVKGGEDYFELLDHSHDADDYATADSYQKSQADLCLGLPFGYTVIPVLEEKYDDVKKAFKLKMVDNKPALDETENGVAFENVKEVTGSTWGYGLRVCAEKARNSKYQYLTWKQPKTSETRDFTVWKRHIVFPGDRYANGTTVNRTEKEDYDAWEIVNYSKDNISEISSGNKKSLKLFFEPGSLTGCYEYAVTYNGYQRAEEGRPAMVSFPDSYSYNLNETPEEVESYDSGVEKEKMNKGYLLAVNLSASYYSGYQEKVEWEKWNYDKRKKGPDKWDVRILNTNRLDGWKSFAASTDKELQVVSGNITASNLVETNIVTNGDNKYSLLLNPVWTSGTQSTKGHLQVLRDARHYYAMGLYREILGETAQVTGEDMAKYAYRKITDEELVRQVTMIMSYAFYFNDGNQNTSLDMAQKKYGEKGSHQAAVGTGTATFTNSERGGGTGRYVCGYEFTNYNCNMMVPYNSETSNKLFANSFVSLTNKNGTYQMKIRGDSDRFVTDIRDTNGNEFVVTTVPSEAECGFSINKSVKIICTELSTSGFLVVTGNKMKFEAVVSDVDGSNSNTVVSLGSVTCHKDTEVNDIRKWIPMALHPMQTYAFNSVGNGWWPEE